MSAWRAPTLRTILALLLGTLACGDDGTARDGRTPATRNAPAPLLPDVTAASGVDFRHVTGGYGEKYLFETMGSGVGIADFQGDGRPDLLLLQSGTLPPGEFREAELKKARHSAGEGAHLYRNDGELRFTDITEGSGLAEPYYAMGLAVGDVDADGDRDVYVGTYGDDRLYLNDGAAHFTNGAAAAGLDDDRWTMAGAFLDADLDGDLDLYTIAFLDMPIRSHRFCGPSEALRIFCHVDGWDGDDDRLWINDGAGRFTDGSAAAGLPGTRGRGLAVVGSDWDDDGDTDLFVANDSMANLVLRNDGGGRFTDISRMSGADLNDDGRSEACMGTDAGDLDGDGDLDLYVANFQRETNTLYRNDGNGFFSDASAPSGAGAPSLPVLGFGTVFLDVENDGDLDIYVANGHVMDNVEELQGDTTWAQPDQLLLNDGTGRFALAPGALGPSLSEPRVGRGLARGDLDGDGDFDLVVSNNGGAPWLLRNDLATGHRIAFRLAGPGGRTDAEGARLLLTVGDRTLVREITSGGSYLSHSDTEVIVGLGDATTVDALTIRWPGGTTSEHGPLDADARYTFAFGGELVASEPLVSPGR